jgi:hypothetical protein
MALMDALSSSTLHTRPGAVDVSPIGLPVSHLGRA